MSTSRQSQEMAPGYDAKGRPTRHRARTIYSLRTFMGSELWWTESRTSAFAIAEQLVEVGDYVHSNGCVGHSGDKGLREFDLPVAVYKCSVAAPRRTARNQPAAVTDPCPKGDPDCETGDDGSCHDGCTAPRPTETTHGLRSCDDHGWMLPASPREG